MSQRELLDQIATLKNRLQKQENIVKRKEAYIKFLKEKLNDQHRMTGEIRDLALKIGNLCNPTKGTAADLEWDSVVSRATNGASIFVSSDVLVPASSYFDDETSQRETAGDETGSGGNTEPSQIFDLIGQRKGVQSISIIDKRTEIIDKRTEKLKQRVNHNYTRRRNSRERNEVTDVSYNIGRNLSQSSQRLEYPAERATQHELLDENGPEDRIKTMSWPARSFLPSRFKKRKKLKPPILSTEVKDYLHAGDWARQSAEIILLPNSDRMSISASPTMNSETPGVSMSLSSNPHSSKYERSVSNVQPRSMSDRSLSSLAEVLPSLPSDNSIIPIYNKNNEGSRSYKLV